MDAREPINEERITGKTIEGFITGKTIEGFPP